MDSVLTLKREAAALVPGVRPSDGVSDGAAPNTVGVPEPKLNDGAGDGANGDAAPNTTGFGVDVDPKLKTGVAGAVSVVPSDG